MSEPLSLRAYAKRRGCSLQAVQRAVRSGRLAASLTAVDGVTKIGDAELADREWAANTDPTRRPSPPPDAELGEVPTEGTPAEDTFAYWKAKKMRLEYERAAGELVNADEMTAAMTQAYTTVRTKLLGLPSKAKQALPHLTLADLATLDEIVREALEALAEAA